MSEIKIPLIQYLFRVHRHPLPYGTHYLISRCYLFTIVRVVGVCGGCGHAGMCSRRALDRRDLVLPPSGYREMLHQQKCLEPWWKDTIRMDDFSAITHDSFFWKILCYQSILNSSLYFSVHRRARTTSQRRKRLTTSRHPTSSTIIFIIIKRTNAETITIILLWQKKEIKKKAFPLKSSSFKTNLLWLYIVNVML